MQHEIPVRIVEDSTIDEVMKEIHKQEVPKKSSSPTKWLDSSVLYFIAGFVSAAMFCTVIFYYKNGEIIEKLDELSNLNIEMQQRTEDIKANVNRNQQAMERYDALSAELTSGIADKIAKKKQKVVEAN